MLNRLPLKPRLILLMTVQTLILIALGLTAVQGLRAAVHGAAQLNKHLIEQVALNQMHDALRTDLLATLSDAAAGRMAWDEAQMEVLAARNLMTSLWDEYQADMTAEEISELRDALAKHYGLLMLSFTDLENIFSEQDKTRLASYQDTQLKRLVTPFITGLNDRIAQQQLQSEEIFNASTSRHWAYVFGSVVLILLGVAATGALGLLVYRSIMGSIDHSHNERVMQAQQDHAQLNDAMLALLHAVSKLDGRDLTVKFQVSEDATGAVADTLNRFIGETGQALIDVRRIAEQVAKAAVMVRTQSDVVIAVAANEQSETDTTAQVLAQATATFNHVAGLAQACNQTAKDTIETAHSALQSITHTVDAFSGIRSTIHETGKRIHQLGERSQDIGRAINALNGIAERTRILALNADMHAAMAGEAGRSFGLVAGEAQRLAEHTRDVAQQFATLVADLQSDTGDTVMTINNAITQVAAGSDLTAQAGEHMLHTRNSMTHLVDSVRRIATDMAEQILLSSQFQERVQIMQVAAHKTREQMQEQTQHTRRLVQYSRGLLYAVQVFTLPGDTATTDEQRRAS